MTSEYSENQPESDKLLDLNTQPDPQFLVGMYPHESYEFSMVLHVDLEGTDPNPTHCSLFVSHQYNYSITLLIYHNVMCNPA